MFYKKFGLFIVGISSLYRMHAGNPPPPPPPPPPLVCLASQNLTRPISPKTQLALMVFGAQALQQRRRYESRRDSRTPKWARVCAY